MEVFLVSPVACRCAGLPVRYVAGIGSPGPAGDDPDGLEDRLGAERDALWSLMEDDRFLACMATMNPGALGLFRREHERGRGEGPRNAKARGRERILYRFVSRFASRNDTTGRAGSTFWGHFGEGGAATPLGVQGLAGAVRRRMVYASPAHAAYLRQELRRRRAPRTCRPALAAPFRWSDDALVDTVRGTVRTPGPADRELLRRCDGSRTVGDLAGEDAAVAARIEELAADGVLELHVSAPPLVPLDRLLVQVVEELQGVPELRDDPVLRGDLGALLDLEDRLRGCAVRDLTDLMQEARELVGRLAPYRPLDPSATLRRTVVECVGDATCRGRLELGRSQRFEVADGRTLRDRLTGAERTLEAGEAEILDEVGEGRTVREALAAVGAEPSDAVEVVAALLEEDVLCVAGADPADHTGTPAADVDWDAWDRALFEATTAALRRMDLPEPWSSALELLPSCRAVEQRCEDDAFPRLNPVLAPERARRTLDEAGVEAVDAGKDRDFFIVDSALPDASFRVAGSLRDGLKSDLTLLFTLLGARAWEWETTELLPRLRNAIPPGGRLPLPVVLDRVLGWARRWPGPFREEERPRVRARHDPESGVVSIEDVEAGPGFEAWMADKRLVGTVDLMVGGTLDEIRDGRWRCVLNEVHATGDGLPETMHTPWTTLTGAPGTGFRDSHAARVFGEDVLLLQPNLPTKQAHSIAWQLRGAGLAVRCEGAGTAWDGPKVRIGELDVERTREGFVVVSRERRWAFLTASFAAGPFRVVTFSPRAAARHLASLAGVRSEPDRAGIRRVPAIELGSLRVTRRSWRLPPGAVRPRLTARASGALLAGAASLREELELPRFVFASLTHEKPFLCDLESIVSLEVLAHALRQDEGALTLVEMDPAPDELWLDLEEGPVTSEWRFVAVAEGSAFTGEPAPLSDPGG